MKDLEELSKQRDAHVHGQEDSISSRCHFFPTWSVDSTQSQPKSQQVLLWMDRLTVQLLRRGKGPEQPTQNRRRTKSEDWGWRTPRLTTRWQCPWKNAQTHGAEPRAQTQTTPHAQQLISDKAAKPPPRSRDGLPHQWHQDSWTLHATNMIQTETYTLHRN